MRSFLLIVAFLGPALIWGQSGEPDHWEKFVFIDGGFELRSPGPLAEQVDTVETALGPLAFHRLFFQTQDAEESDNLVYEVSWVQYPEGVFPPDSTALIDDFFQETIAEAVKAVRGELGYATPIILQRYPGYLWRINYLNEKAIIKTKAFLKRDTYIAISGVAFRHKSLNASLDRFLDSFRFLE